MLKLYQNPFKYLRWLHDTYGDLVTLAQGNASYVCAFGPALNFQLLTDPHLFGVGDTELVKIRKDTTFGKLMTFNLPQMNGEKHRQHRRLMQPAFHKQQVARYCEDMIALTQQTLDSWRDQSQIDLHHEMQRLTQRIAVKTLFGLYDEAELTRVGALMRDMSRSLLLVMVLPLDIPGTPYARVLRISEQLDAFIRATIARKREQQDATDVLATLIQAHDEDGTKLSDDELVGHAFTLFAAGHETTSNALTWTLFLLSQHPRVFADLLDELEGTLHGNAPTVELLSHLPLLDGVVKESLRLLPPASIGIRVTSASCELGGFTLPKGASIIYSEFVTHRLPELYQEPDRFKPERWATLDRSPYEYLPFSAGRHMCIGAGFATQEMKVVLAMLLQRYRLSVVPKARISSNISMRPPHGMPMRVFPQDRQFQRVPIRGTITELIDFTQ
jgi:cytochrome P450